MRDKQDNAINLPIFKEDITMNNTEKIAQYEQLIQAQRQYREESLQAQLNEIGTKLKAEYEDFYETQDCEMSIMLGEIYKHKLLQVAKILRQCGIDI